MSGIITCDHMNLNKLKRIIQDQAKYTRSEHHIKGKRVSKFIHCQFAITLLNYQKKKRNC